MCLCVYIHTTLSLFFLFLSLYIFGLTSYVRSAYVQCPGSSAHDKTEVVFNKVHIDNFQE